MFGRSKPKAPAPRLTPAERVRLALIEVVEKTGSICCKAGFIAETHVPAPEAGARGAFFEVHIKGPGMLQSCHIIEDVLTHIGVTDVMSGPVNEEVRCVRFCVPSGQEENIIAALRNSTSSLSEPHVRDLMAGMLTMAEAIYRQCDPASETRSTAHPLIDTRGYFRRANIKISTRDISLTDIMKALTATERHHYELHWGTVPQGAKKIATVQVVFQSMQGLEEFKAHMLAPESLSKLHSGL